MKAIDIELPRLQTFKDLNVYDKVSRKTIPRGSESIYSHIVFDKTLVKLVPLVTRGTRSIRKRNEMYS
jgi:hypothetical protein